MTKKDTKAEKQNFYFTIHSFMTHELGLRGSALIIYAIIYAFSQDGKGTFYGSREFLAEYGGIGLTSVKSAIKLLLADDLILITNGENFEHKEYVINRDKFNEKNSFETNIKDLSGSRISTAGVSDSDRDAVGFGIRSSRISTARVSDSDRYNKNNNKYNNKLIFNSYNGADAEKKEKNIFNFSDSGGAQTVNNEKENLLKPTYKHCNFDPEEAFRVALERTEELYREINEKE